MRYLRVLAVFAMVLFAASFAHAQGFSVGVGIGVPVPAPILAGPPVCTYGYYPYYPYACAPYGYYGPEWFAGGVFIGAGPWFHAPAFWGNRVFFDRGWHDYRAGIGWRGPVGRGPAGGFHGGAVVRGGGAFHGAGGFHGGGFRR